MQPRPLVLIHRNTVNVSLGFPASPFRTRLGSAGGAVPRCLRGTASGALSPSLSPGLAARGSAFPRRGAACRRGRRPAAPAMRASSLRKVSPSRAGGTGSERLGRARPGAGLAVTFPLLFAAVT